MSRIHEKNFIDIDSLPHKDGIGKNKGRLVVDWEKTIGHLYYQTRYSVLYFIFT